MARPMNPLPTQDSPLTAFAAALRELRRTAGSPTLQELVARTGLGRTKLSEAHSGKVFPQWATVEAYVRACGASPADWWPRWENLQRTLRAEAAAPALARTVRNWAHSGRLVPPHIKSERELAAALNEMRRFRGLSLRDLARRRPGYSHHAYGSMLNGKSAPTVRMLLALLEACEVRELNSVIRWLRCLATVHPSQAFDAVKTVDALQRQERLHAQLHAAAVRREQAQQKQQFDAGALRPARVKTVSRVWNKAA